MFVMKNEKCLFEFIIRKKSMIHINSGMKYTTCSVSHTLIQNRYLSTFSLSSVRVSGPQKQNKKMPQIQLHFIDKEDISFSMVPA